MEDERGREIGLFRYALIREAADPSLSPRERGRLVRDLASREHRTPDGRVVRVSRPTLDRWIRAWRQQGFDGLVPKPRRGKLLSDVELLDLAVRLKRENPKRAATHICELIATELASRDDGRRVPSARTIQRHFARLGLHRHPGPAPKVFHRFEAAARNDRWIGDGMHGPKIRGGRAILLAFVDDYSRLIPGHHWGRAEDSVRLEAALRRGIASRGVPRQLYADHGSPWVAAPLHRACAVLGIQLSHAAPGEPAGRGKIERFFRTVRSQFLVEVEHRGTDDLPLEQLQAWFSAWLEQRYHRRVHSETKQTPIERFVADGIPEVPGPDLLREAFLWSDTRTVTKTATVNFKGNRYEVESALVGRKVELVFDPFDLSHVEVRWNDISFGIAVLHELKTDVHPDVSGRRDHDDDPPPPTGIDYLTLVEAEHREATRRSINFADLDPHGSEDNDRDDDEDKEEDR